MNCAVTRVADNTPQLSAHHCLIGLAGGGCRLPARIPLNTATLSTRASLLNLCRCVSHNVGMNDPIPQDPRRRLRELLAIPERDRSDEQWDEIIEIEITIAPGNRESDRPADRQPERQAEKRQGVPSPGRRQEQRKTGTRPTAPRPEQRPPPARPETVSDAQPDARASEPRTPKRHVRRPRRPPDTPGES